MRRLRVPGLILLLISQQALAEGTPPGPNVFEQLVPWAFILIAMWFILFLPQKKRMKLQEEFNKALKKGDEVVTNSGIFGTVAGLTDKFVTLEVADGVKIRILRNQISSLVKEDGKNG